MLPPSMTSARQSQSTLHHCPLVYRPSDESLLAQPHIMFFKLWEYIYLCTHLPRSPPAGEWSWRVSSVQPCNPLPSHQRMRTTSTSGPIRNQLRFWWRFRKRLSYLPSFGLASEYCVWNWEKLSSRKVEQGHTTNSSGASFPIISFVTFWYRISYLALVCCNRLWKQQHKQICRASRQPSLWEEELKQPLLECQFQKRLRQIWMTTRQPPIMVKTSRICLQNPSIS